MRSWAKLDEGKVVEIVKAERWPASDEPGISYCPALPGMAVGKLLTLQDVRAAAEQHALETAAERREAELAEDARVAAQEPEPPPEPDF